MRRLKDKPPTRPHKSSSGWGFVADAPPPTYRPEPSPRRVTVGGKVYAAWAADAVLDWLSDESVARAFDR